MLAASLLTLALGLAAAPVDRSLYRGSERLSDRELAIFLEHFGGYFQPGMRLPHWAPRWVERFEQGFAAPPPSTPAEQDATVGPNVSVSNDPTRVHSESFVAVDRLDPLRLIGGSNQMNANPQALFWSADGGNTWGFAEMALGGAQMHSDPGVAWDSQGVGYAVALGLGSSTEVQLVRTLDGGRTWSSPPDIVHSQPGNDKELMAADQQPASPCRDTVCIAWDEISGGSARLWVACAAQGLAPWRIVNVAQGELIGAIPAFGPDGELFVAWSNIGDTSIDFVRSDDCGRSYSLPQPLAQTRVGYDLGIPAFCNRRALVYPAIDVDRSLGPRRGSVYAVWTDATPAANCPLSRCATSCTSNVYFSRSGNGGVSWTAPVPVHTDTTNVDQFNPWLAVNDTDGAVNVMWVDTRNDPAREKSDIYYRRSLDGGQTWESEDKVSAGMTDEANGGEARLQYGDYNGLAAFQCQAWPYWTDRSAGGNEQIFTATVQTQAPMPAPGDLGNSLRGVADAARAPAFTWTDLGGAEVDYRVYRSDTRDFALAARLIGLSGGPDQVRYTDPAPSAAPGVLFYKVRAIGPCGEENASW